MKNVVLAGLVADLEALRFPVRDSIRPGESGQGYALRMVSENHLTGLQQIKHWLGKSPFAVLDRADAAMLHQWFGADIAQLEFALGKTSHGTGESGFIFAGRHIGRSYFVNRTYPRICPTCTQESGSCSTAWDVSLVVSCPRHQVVLSDRCSFCQKSLTWNRARVDACSCGVIFEAPSPVQVVTANELQFSTWVEQRIGVAGKETVDPPARPQDLTALMTLLWPLSLDGGLYVAYALGTAAGYDDQDGHDLKRPRGQLAKARHVLAKASDFAENIARLEPIRLRVSRPSVVVDLLAASASAQATPEDRGLAQSILLTVLGQKRTRWTGVHPQLSQLTLF